MRKKLLYSLLLFSSSLYAQTDVECSSPKDVKIHIFNICKGGSITVYLYQDNGNNLTVPCVSNFDDYTTLDVKLFESVKELTVTVRVASRYLTITKINFKGASYIKSSETYFYNKNKKELKITKI